MSLGEHLTELRDRLLWCAGTVLIMTIVGWNIYIPVFNYLQKPFDEARKLGLDAKLNFQGVGTGLSAQLAMSAYIGLILAAPMIIFQAWRFITPGLHKHERRYTLGFFGAAVPLFFVGCAAGYFMMNKAVPVLMEFTPNLTGVTQIINYNDYLTLLVRTVLAFGVAFILPVVLVLLNFMGVLPGRTMLKAWRWVTLVCFCFTAVMVPTPDPFTMIFMALPMVGLYFAAVTIGFVHDRHKARQEGDIPDDQASVIDDVVEPVEAPSALDEVSGR